MFVAMSQRSRRFVGRLDRGQELNEAVREICREHDVRCGEVRAFGLLSAAELSPYDREARGYAAPRRLRAFFELVNLSGTITTKDGELSLHLHATLSRDNHDRGGGIDILGGLLVAAEVLTCELVIDAFDDLTLIREFNPALGIYTLARAEPRAFMKEDGTNPFDPRPAPSSRPSLAASRAAPLRAPEVVHARRPRGPGKTVPIHEIPEGSPPVPRVTSRSATADSEPSWDDAVRASEKLAVDGAATLRAGDFLDHPKFGRCEVQRIDEDAERISVRLANGRLVELGLAVLHLEPAGREGERQLFRVHTSGGSRART